MDGLAHDTDLIRKLVSWANLAPATVAKRAEIAASTVNRPFNGTATTRLGRAAMEKLQRAFPDFPGWPAGDALAEDRLPFRGFNAEREPESVEIAYIDLRFGLGSAIMDQEILEHQAEMQSFPRAWLRIFTESPPSQLYWARGQGDSMEPKIRDGDLILIDRSQVSGGFGDLIWAISYGQTGMIKRLRPMPDGSLKILSDNPSVPPELAYDGEVHVFGRVVAVLGRT